MKKNILIALFIIIIASGSIIYFRSQNTSGEDKQDTRIEKALAKKDCPPKPKVPNFGPAYEGPLIDTHIHIPHIQEGPLSALSSSPTLGGNVTLGDYECVFNMEGTSKAFAFFPVFKEFKDIHLGIVKGASEQYQDIFVPFIMPPDSDNDLGGFPTVKAEILKEMLNVFPGLFRGYGEIGLYARRNDRGEIVGGAELPPDAERLKEIYPVIRDNNLLIYFHLGEGQQDSYEKTLSANPDINFIFHGDQLVLNENGEQNLKAIDEILNRHKNVYYGIDELYGDVWLLRPDKKKEEFLAHFENYKSLLRKDVATWKAFIERHPDQVLWGTDRGVANNWSMDPEVGMTLTRYARTFIALLAPEVQEKFAHQNAERLIK